LFRSKTRIREHVLGKFYPIAGGAVAYDENKVTMMDLKELTGKFTLNGEYTLDEWIGTDQTGDTFAATSDTGEPVVAKLAPAADRDAEARLAVWQRSRHLRHKHLLDARDSGRVELEGATYIYGIFERPDDILATALAQGPLGEEETHGVVEAALSALRYLHGQGLVHGAVDPDHVVAVGDVVKLSTDSLREADGMRARAEDVRQLGELVQTLRAPEPLGEPFETVVRHATEPDPAMRWTLAEIAVAIEPPPVAPAPVPVPPPTPPPPPAPVFTPSVEERRPVAAATAQHASPPLGFPRWIFAGVAILLLAILGFNLRRKPEAPVSQAVLPAALPAPAPPSERASPIERPSPLSRAAVPNTSAPRAATSQKLSSKAVWRVIAFTYGSHDMAANKAKQVNGRWPEMKASVLAANDRRGLFLVALGGPVTKDEAARVQRKARSLGLPGDTYIQNFSE
jgi:hypothetical protein